MMEILSGGGIVKKW